MSLSRTIEKCQNCPIADICDDKLMEALGELLLPCENMAAAQPTSVNIDYAAMQEGIDKIRQEIYDFVGIPKELVETELHKAQYEAYQRMFVEPMKPVIPKILTTHFIFK